MWHSTSSVTLDVFWNQGNDDLMIILLKHTTGIAQLSDMAHGTRLYKKLIRFSNILFTRINICNENENNPLPLNCMAHSQTNCKVNLEIIISQLNIPLFFIFINFQCICYHSLFTSGYILTCNKVLSLRLCAGIYCRKNK